MCVCVNKSKQSLPTGAAVGRTWELYHEIDLKWKWKGTLYSHAL